MREFETVREALEFLETINNPKCEVKSATVKDVQEMNYETIASLCDLLGMSDVYLRDREGDSNGAKRNDNQTAL